MYSSISRANAFSMMAMPPSFEQHRRVGRRRRDGPGGRCGGRSARSAMRAWRVRCVVATPHAAQQRAPAASASMRARVAAGIGWGVRFMELVSSAVYRRRQMLARSARLARRRRAAPTRRGRGCRGRTPAGSATRSAARSSGSGSAVRQQPLEHRDRRQRGASGDDRRRLRPRSPRRPAWRSAPARRTAGSPAAPRPTSATTMNAASAHGASASSTPIVWPTPRPPANRSHGFQSFAITAAMPAAACTPAP